MAGGCVLGPALTWLAMQIGIRVGSCVRRRNIFPIGYWGRSDAPCRWHCDYTRKLLWWPILSSCEVRWHIHTSYIRIHRVSILSVQACHWVISLKILSQDCHLFHFQHNLNPNELRNQWHHEIFDHIPCMAQGRTHKHKTDGEQQWHAGRSHHSEFSCHHFISLISLQTILLEVSKWQGPEYSVRVLRNIPRSSLVFSSLARLAFFPQLRYLRLKGLHHCFMRFNFVIVTLT